MRRRHPQILRNAFYLLVMNAGTLAALFVFSVLLARILGKEALGLYALFTALLFPFVFFVDFGQSTALVQEISREPHRSNQIIRNTLLIKLALTAVAGLALVLLSGFFFSNIRERHLFWIFGLLILPRAVYSTFEAVLRANQRMLYPMMVNLIAAPVLLAGTWFLLHTGQGFISVVLFLVAVEMLRAALSWYLCKTRLGLDLRDDGSRASLSYSRHLLKRSLPFFTIGIAGALYYRLDVVLLARMTDHGEVGVFSAAASFVKVMRIVPSVMVASFFPVISGLEKGSSRARHLTWKTLGLQFATSLALSVLVFALADRLIQVSYQIPESARILKVFVWSVVPLSLYSTLLYAFFQSDKARWGLWIMSLAVLLNLGANYLLIPELGAMALAVSTVVSESFSFLACAMVFLFLLRPAPGRPESRALPLPEVSAFNYKAST